LCRQLVAQLEKMPLPFQRHARGLFIVFEQLTHLGGFLLVEQAEQVFAYQGAAFFGIVGNHACRHSCSARRPARIRPLMVPSGVLRRLAICSWVRPR
jgi:hypothetical protein